MTFKKLTPPSAVPDSPDKLLRLLPRRRIPDVLPHQQAMMQAYASTAVHDKDVALQLPTGSGKTLVGLLIGEWRRRRSNERVVYLCPTRQLVNQVIEQAEEKYGLSVVGFTGAIRNYAPSAKADYRNADRIAIATYNSLFNSNPFFDDADVVIVDDAHTAENYIATMWTLRVERARPEHATLHAALCGLLKTYIEPGNLARLRGRVIGTADRSWVDKMPTPILFQIKDELVEMLDEHIPEGPLSYSWGVLRDNLQACHLYMSADEILIRPLIAPTWEHPPFTTPSQRIFMSATLGAGGDLERLTGRKNIKRLPTPTGWDLQGVGRRYFLFPEMSLKSDEAERLRTELMRRSGRSLVLVPSDPLREKISKQVRDELHIPTFSADDIEVSKKPFVTSEKAVAIVANRYDGIDFPGDECRLLFIEGLPKATNLQERFLMARMGANILFNERIQTRVRQAIGRCTRSLEDYSAVVVSGQELPDYLTNVKRRPYLHPELQAELAFGVGQSKDVKFRDFIENFEIFLRNGKEWEEADGQIIAARDASTQTPFPGMADLGAAAEYEIEWQAKMWQGDYEAALGAAERTLGALAAPELRGYRALWHYLAGSTSWLGAKQGIARLELKARSHFTEAKRAATAIPWLVRLAMYDQGTSLPESRTDPSAQEQIERVEAVLSDLGTQHDRSFAAREREILDGLSRPDRFEQAQRSLGELLGFSAGKVEREGSPDPWWIAGRYCFVFEDYVDCKDGAALGVNKARQAESHPKWMKENVPECADCEILVALVSPIADMKKSAVAHAKELAFWSVSEFHSWAENAIAAVRKLRTTFVEPGDLSWRAEALEAFEKNRLTPQAVYATLKSNPAVRALKIVG